MVGYKVASLDREAKEKLVSVYRILDDFAGWELPLVRENCRKARSEVSQILLRMGLLGEIGDATKEEARGLFVDG